MILILPCHAGWQSYDLSIASFVDLERTIQSFSNLSSLPF